MQTRQAGLEGTGEVSLRDLVRETLRMRPTRIIVGEVRAAECLDLLLALNAGLPGMATLHANSAREALVKLCTLPLLAGENISARFVVPTVASSVDLVVHLGLDSGGVRRVNEIVAVPGRVENDIVETEPVFVRQGGDLVHTGGMPTRLDTFERAGIDVHRLLRGRRLMGAVLGLLLGVGLLLIWSRSGRPSRGRRRAASRLRPLLSQCRARRGERRRVPVRVRWSVPSSRRARSSSPRGPLPVALVFGAMGGYLPVAVLKGRARRRQREFAEVWPEAVDNLASAVRAGMSLPEALAALSERGPEPLREAFAGFALDYQVSGRFADSLDRLKDRLADPVGDRVVESLRVAREVGGGDLGRLLRSLSGFLRDDARTRSELESRQAWTVNGARLAVAAPWLVLLLMCFQPEVIQRYSTGAGVVVLVGGAVLCVVAYRVMVRIGRLPTERRILS